MEIKRLTAEHYDALLALLNDTFGNKAGKPVDFLSVQPKMWVRDDEHMRCHFGVFEDGRLCAVVGIYPLRTVIDGTPFLFATTGNVATHPDYEGRGYFNLLFTEVMKELETIGADAGRLGGLRQRYGHFGYEGCGVSYLFLFGPKNRISCFGEKAGTDIIFTPIDREDTETLAFCRELRMRSPIYVERPSDNDYRDIYLSLCSKCCKPYLATRDGKPVGYLCAADEGKSVHELEAPDVDAFRDIVCGWQAKCGRDINLAIPAFNVEQIRLLCATAESYRVTYPSRFKILNWQGITDATMRLGAKTAPMLDGEFVLEIEGYGTIRLFVRDGKAGCERTDAAPELTLDRLAAARLLFGPTDPISVADLPPIPRSWLPLPFSWGAMDAI